MYTDDALVWVLIFARMEESLRSMMLLLVTFQGAAIRKLSERQFANCRRREDGVQFEGSTLVSTIRIFVPKTQGVSGDTDTASSNFVPTVVTFESRTLHRSTGRTKEGIIVIIIAQGSISYQEPSRRE